MHASTHTITKSLADAAQAMGLDAMSALAAELSARMAPAEAIAVKVEPSPELRAAMRSAAPKVTATISAEDVVAALGFDRETVRRCLRAAGMQAGTVTGEAFGAVGPEDQPEPLKPTTRARRVEPEDNTGLDPEGYATEDERFDRAMARMAAVSAGTYNRARFKAFFEATGLAEALGDLADRSTANPSRESMSATAERDDATGTLEAVIIDHPLFTVEIKLRG